MFNVLDFTLEIFGISVFEIMIYLSVYLLRTFRNIFSGLATRTTWHKLDKNDALKKC